MSAKHKLTFNERWILSNQYRLLELVAKDSVARKHYKDAQTILKNGYEILYHNLSQDIFNGNDIFSEEQGQEVKDILHMFDEIDNSYINLPNKEGIEEYLTRFSGFDGNEEGAYLGFVSFYCEDGENFASVVKKMRGDKFNSHVPMLGAYRRMLAVWQPIESKLESSHRLLTAKEIKAIVDEQIHPDARSPKQI